MSPSNNIRRIAAGSRAGLSLVELLIAIAIFATIMGGVSALYGGAIRTVRQGYDTIDKFETARAVLSALEEDLKSAFSTPQFGESYQFYGEPGGFMYVGTLPNGQLGRVSYVLNANASANTFETILVEPHNSVLQRAERQVRAWAVENGLNQNTVWTNFQVAFEANYPVPSPVDTPTEFSVLVTTQSLLRYEEQGVNDLSTFNLSRLPSGPGAAPGYGIQWPYVDPREPAFDDPNGDRFGAESAYESVLYAQMLSGLNPFAPQSQNLDYDLRELIRVAAFTPGLSLIATNASVVSTLIDAKRRELWLDLLAEDNSTGLPGFWNTGLVGDPRLVREDFVIADDILARARLLVAGGGAFLDLQIPEANNTSYTPLRLDALDVPGMFTYGSDQGTFNPYFNTVERVPGFENFLDNARSSSGNALIAEFDGVLTEFLSGPRLSSVVSGVPLTPRLPAMAQPGFWLMDQRVSPSAPDYRRWFVQIVDVPAGSSRNLPARFVANQDKV